MSYTPPAGGATLTTKGTVRLAGDLSGTADSPSVTNVSRATSGGLETVSTFGAATGAVTLNLANGNVFDVTLSGDVTFSFSGATNGKACSFTLFVKQGATARTVTWPSSASLKWADGIVPTVTATANAVDIFVFESINGGATWYGSLVGKNFA